MKYAIIFRYDGGENDPDLLEYDPEDENFSWKETLRMPADRHVESGRVAIWSESPFKPEFMATVVCDDKPSDQCYADDDTNHNGWHTRMYGDFAIVVDTKEQAKRIIKEPTPMAWWQ